MKPAFKSLGVTLSNLPDPMPKDCPLPLPIVHVSIARWFGSIVNSGKLKTTHCKIFRKKLIYFFYGGVFYRPQHKPTRNVAELPVAFVFNPSALKRILQFYPFDTGAMATGRFGNWSNLLMPFSDSFRVAGNRNYELASKIVYYLFGNNDLYIQGEPDPACKKRPDPMPQLYDFYSDDLSDLGADQRQCMIECQSNRAVPLNQDVLWVGFPESMTLEFANLCKWTKPYIPQFYAYPSHKINSPSEVTAKLEEIARNHVIKRFLRMP